MAYNANLQLAGRKILVTRPFKQANMLARLIEQQGGEVILLPVIDIVPVDVVEWQMWQPQQTDWLMFVSPNAVACFMAGYQGHLPKHIKLVAAGEGTAQAMREHGLQVDLQPELSNGSEGLLPLPQWHQMHQQQVVIVRGDGGRELMADTLRARGATVTYLEVYRRQLPVVSASVLQQACLADWLTVTSVNGVKNLLHLLSAKRLEILEKPLLVVSNRIRDFAIEQGFKRVYVSSDVSDIAMVQRLIEMGSDYGS